MKLRLNLEQWRKDGPPLAEYGMFRIPSPYGKLLQVVASAGDSSIGADWEHVAVSLKTRCPNWNEMCFVKDLFWDPEETVMQLHPPRSQWISLHPFCLHMWRPKNETIPLPPWKAV